MIPDFLYAFAIVCGVVAFGEMIKLVYVQRQFNAKLRKQSSQLRLPQAHTGHI
jgi:hypothetical protein